MPTHNDLAQNGNPRPNWRVFRTHLVIFWITSARICSHFCYANRQRQINGEKRSFMRGINTANPAPSLKFKRFTSFLPPSMTLDASRGRTACSNFMPFHARMLNRGKIQYSDDGRSTTTLTLSYHLLPLPFQRPPDVYELTIRH